MVEGEGREERDKEKEIIQLHRLCSRSQTICVCKEQKRRKKRGEKEKKRKEGGKDEMSITEKETGNPSKGKRDREGRKGEDR